MKITVVYGSRSGNTRVIAEAIAESLGSRGEVELVPAEKAGPSQVSELLVVGGPTEGHGMTPVVSGFLASLPQLQGVQVAAFDTRLKWPIWLSGSAAKDIAERLQHLGGVLLAPPESFLVTMEPKLYPGELERAEAWALALPIAGKVAQAV